MLIRFYQGGFDPWELTLPQWHAYIEAMIDVGGMEKGEVDNRANVSRMRLNAPKLRRFNEALAESKHG